MAFHDYIQEKDGWRVIARTPCYVSPHLIVNELTVSTPSRPKGVHWIEAQRKAACVVVPRLANGSYLLVRQERVPLLTTLWEFPAGQIEPTPGATQGAELEALALTTALRELHEETSHELAPGAELIPLGHFFSSPGFMDELSFLFLATEVRPSASLGVQDSGEAILEARAFSPDDLTRMIADGEIRDANTLAAFARLTAQNRW